MRIVLDNFAGGLNLRDSPNELAANETPDATNFTLDERGALRWRNGCANAVALPGLTGQDADIFYSDALDLWLCARRTAGAPDTYRLHSRPGDFSGSWTDRGKIASPTGATINSSGVRATFADWPGTTPFALIATSKSDATDGGVYTFDGTTLTKRFANDVYAIAVWQNKVWVITPLTLGSNTSIIRLNRSAVGDPTTGYSTDFTDFREKDAANLVALGVAGGALIVFKRRSTYRVNDSSSGAYSMIDPAVGCTNARALAAMKGRLYVWAFDSLYECDGVGPMRNVGDKARPIFLEISGGQ